jgi:hypothetical protein
MSKRSGRLAADQQTHAAEERALRLPRNEYSGCRGTSRREIYERIPSALNALTPSALAIEYFFPNLPISNGTRRMAAQLDTVHGSDWQKNNTSDFEYDSLSDSDAPSEYLSDFGSITSEDLKLYDARCVH